MASEPANYRNGFQFVDMKQQNRFIMSIPDFFPDGAAGSWLIKTTDLPSIENNPVVVDTINSEYKIKGKSRWQDISVSFYDPIRDLTGVNQAYTWQNFSHHISRQDVDFYMQTYKRDISLKYVAPDGSTPQGEWTLHGGFFANINWGSLDVSSDDLVMIEATISYDWAEFFA